ncbi:hypothetical protein SI65_05130 [Aspergillus cristatus]|uniref:Rab-GAP TBC domain-containing protein n=1 Tax=Aspergillus cristatus TaxID=573508 RepID=A0A1E3BGQ1_ASPCR|nr:hypothetical protein SI65_05130 [Aspergillus cristatus]
MADSEAQARSPSQTSSSSSRPGHKTKTVRALSQKRHSTSSNTTSDLTSFPSLSPDRSPEGFVGEPALNRSLANALVDGEADNGGGSDIGRTRNRKATLAKLTSESPASSGRVALFDDSVALNTDVPGALHLADDAHIERLVASNGAVKLVRQFARDLALRDAEISRLRQRADKRERELKRMLREVSVSNQDIERRLYALDNRDDTTNGRDSGSHADQGSNGIDGLMQQAMTDDVGSEMHEEVNGLDSQTTLRPQQLDNDAKFGASSELGVNRKRQSGRGWQDYIFGSTAGSRKTSRASSVMSDVGDVDETNKPVRRKTFDEQLSGEQKTKPAGDDSSMHSRKSSNSLSSWAAKLLVGNNQGKGDSTESGRKTPSGEQPRNRAVSSANAPKGGMTAVAALKRINSNAPGAPGKPNGPVRTNAQAPRRSAPSVSQGSEMADKTSNNLGPVEMDAILPMESRPPTLTHTYNNYQPGDLLTDRFGFIYDQRRKKRQREARSSVSRLSITETLSSFRSDSDGDETPASPERPLSSPSPEDPDSGAVQVRKWQDYLKIPSKPTELLSHTPSAGPIVALTTGDDSQPRSASFSVDKSGSVSVNPARQPSASTSAVVADRPEFAGTSADEPSAAAVGMAISNEQEPVRLLLDQLTDLHDSLQRDRTVRWNEFLRKVRAERKKEGEAAAAAAAAADRPLQSIDTPEASLADGEVIGIAGLGNKGKVGRAKWKEFRSLVLGGIPVSLRAKVWSECSGASAMRIPGYYEDLVTAAGGSDPDPSVVAQIDMDIHRTLTDNVFFRMGPGVGKLRDVLLAYSRRNPEVGYCQGMNLIAASLLLITPTAEDAFWILVSMIEVILPQHYYDHGLLASRADQVVLRQYITEVLPKLSAHLDDLGIELEALTFQWFLSVFTDCLSAEALYRVWDVVLCLNASTVTNNPTSSTPENDPSTNAAKTIASGSGGGSTFLFQVALALLKLNEQQLLTTCLTPAALYTYINHQMTNHAISIDGLIHASEALRNVVRREDVVERRTEALREMREFN